MTKRKKSTAKIQDGGLTPKQETQIRAAVRQVWMWSTARRLVLKRAMDAQGFAVCDLCLATTPKVQVDHIVPCGAVQSVGWLERMFCPSSGLRALCPACHKAITKAQAKA